MKLYSTSIRAINPKTGKLTTYFGPNIPAICKAEAEYYCEHNELGYCEVGDPVNNEVPSDDTTLEADFSKRVVYDFSRN